MKSEEKAWFELLDELIGREGLSRRQVAQRAGVSSKTITSWLRGDVQSPRAWQPLAQVLRTLNATAVEAEAVLAGAGYADVGRLAQHADGADTALLAGWLKQDAPFMPPERLTATLIGRDELATEVVQTLQRRGRCVLLGMAGVGKTALALEVAHRMRRAYGDGVFWGDLRVGVADAVLESWGQACGVSMGGLTDFNSRAAAVRALFTRKQALIVLDDVVDSQQALQMIPAQAAGCAVLATTRSLDVAQALTRMGSGLVQRLEPMAREDSLLLLATIVGEVAVTQARGAAEEIADLLGDMPLALHICGALCAGEGLSLGQMAVLLRDLRSRLEYLRLEEKPLVRLAFEQSWQLLDESARRGLATLGVFEGRPFGRAAFAATGDMGETEAALLLNRLCRYSLLTAMGSSGRYQQHALLAAFAAEKLGEEEETWVRYVNYYENLLAEDGWYEEAGQGTWGNVMGAMAAARRMEMWDVVLAFARRLQGVWQRQGYYDLARQGYGWAVEALGQKAPGEEQVEADIRLAWGRACLEQSDYAEAKIQLRAALDEYGAMGQTAGVAEAHYHLARVAVEQGGYDEAEAAIQGAYRAYQEVEDARGMGRALFQLSYIVYFRGEFERAARLTADAIRSQVHVGDEVGLLRSYRLAAQIGAQLAKIEEAEGYCRAAETLVARVNDRAELAAYYYTYAEVLRQKQAFGEAQDYGEKALALFREMADGSSQANALLMLAGNEVNWNDAEPEREEVARGLAYCDEALAVCEAVGYAVGKAFGLLAQGRLLAQGGDEEAARASWQEGLALAQTLQHTWLVQRLQGLIGG